VWRWNQGVGGCYRRAGPVQTGVRSWRSGGAGHGHLIRQRRARRRRCLPCSERTSGSRTGAESRDDPEQGRSGCGGWPAGSPEKSSSYALAGDVADDEAEPPLADIEEVEIIASHLASGKAQASVFESLGLGMDLRKQARLYLLGDFQFLSRTAFGFKLLGVRFLHGESTRRSRQGRTSYRPRLRIA
jgi:hypothetical protein